MAEEKLQAGLADKTAAFDEQKIKILMVEDSPNINMLYNRGLPDALFEKSFAHNGQEAMTLYHQWHPDIIILDIMLPVMTGYSVLKEIRGTLKDTSTAIIMSTSLSKKEDVMSMMKLGIQGYIVKPFGVREIGARILAYYKKIDPPRAASALSMLEGALDEAIHEGFKEDAPAQSHEEKKEL